MYSVTAMDPPEIKERDRYTRIYYVIKDDKSREGEKNTGRLDFLSSDRIFSSKSLSIVNERSDHQRLIRQKFQRLRNRCHTSVTSTRVFSSFVPNISFFLETSSLSTFHRTKERKRGNINERRSMFGRNLHIYRVDPGSYANFCPIFSITCYPVKRSCSVNPQVRIGKWWRKPRGVAYGVAGGSLFKTPMRFLYLTGGYLSTEFYRKPAVAEWRFILCQRPADQSNRIKNNEIARYLSNQKRMYITYIHTYPRTLSTLRDSHQPGQSALIIISLFSPCPFGSSWSNDKGRSVSKKKKKGLARNESRSFSSIFILKN